jgi:hypothetical protein
VTANFQFSSFRGDAKHRTGNDELVLEDSAARENASAKRAPSG